MTEHTVREATFAVLRERGLTTLFANPGSTEVPFLVGQQDRRHLTLEPFLAGHLEGLAGDYPLEVISPVRAADVPSSVHRASLVAEQGRGPVLVIVPMNDWGEIVDPSAAPAAAHVAVGHRAVPDEIATVATALTEARNPGLVAGSACDTEEGWRAMIALAERIDAPVWIEPFGSRAGFPQTHRLYQGQLPADRPRVREALSGIDVLLVVGTAALRQYPFSDGGLFPQETRVFVATDDAAEANRSPVELAVVGEIRLLVDAVADLVPPATTPRRDPAPAASGSHLLPAPRNGEPLRAAHVFETLARGLPEDTILLEESPSSRPALQAIVPARRPLGFVSAAMGGLGFAMPAGIGFKMALSGRPVIVVVGDGSSMYSIQSLWTALERGVGVLFVVLANGGYAVMDRLAEQRGSKAAWPSFPQLSVSAIARGFGVEAHRIETYADLQEVLGAACAGLAERTEPLLLEIAVQPDTSFAP